MKLRNQTAELFIPDGAPEAKALARATHMAIAAHQDDIEIMALHGILECFGHKDKGFVGVTVTNGSGSPRDGIYAKYSDAEMMNVRRQEQKKAAIVGEYVAMALLDYPSAALKDAKNTNAKDDIRDLVASAKPDVVYTHNLADKHDTHVAVALRAIQALRELPEADRPEKVFGCEVWRGLDWMMDADKVVLDVSNRENLSAALLGIFDSQIAGGKRYDLASTGRRRANATYFASHGVDQATEITFAMDLTPLVKNPKMNIEEFTAAQIQKLEMDVTERIRKMK